MSIVSITAVTIAALGGLRNFDKTNVGSRPTFGCEMGNVEFDDNVQAYLENYYMNKRAKKFPTSQTGKKKNKVTLEEAEGNKAFCDMMDYFLTDDGFLPEYMTYNTIYPVDNIGKPMDYDYGSFFSIPKYTEFKYADKNGSVATFIFADEIDLEALNIDGDVFVYPGLTNRAVLQQIYFDVCKVFFLRYLQPVEYIYDKSSGFTSNEWSVFADTALSLDVKSYVAESNYTATVSDMDSDSANIAGVGRFVGMLPIIIDYLFDLFSSGVFKNTGIDFAAEMSELSYCIDNNLLVDDWRTSITTTINQGPGSYYTTGIGIGFFIGLFPIAEAAWIIRLIYLSLEPINLDFGAQIETICNDVGTGRNYILDLKKTNWSSIQYANVALKYNFLDNNNASYAY